MIEKTAVQKTLVLASALGLSLPLAVSAQAVAGGPALIRTEGGATARSYSGLLIAGGGLSFPGMPFLPLSVLRADAVSVPATAHPVAPLAAVVMAASEAKRAPGYFPMGAAARAQDQVPSAVLQAQAALSFAERDGSGGASPLYDLSAGAPDAPVNAQSQNRKPRPARNGASHKKASASAAKKKYERATQAMGDAIRDTFDTFADLVPQKFTLTSDGPSSARIVARLLKRFKKDPRVVVLAVTPTSVTFETTPADLARYHLDLPGAGHAAGRPAPKKKPRKTR